MNSEIVNTLRGIYCTGNPDLLVRKCNSKIVFWDEVVEKVKSIANRVTVFDSAGSLTEKLHADVNTVCINGITIKYSSTLYVSKIAGFYYFRHDLHTDNPDRDALEPFFHTFGDCPYSTKQFYLDEMAVQYFGERGYRYLCYGEMAEIFPDKIYSPVSGQYELRDLSSLLFDLPYMQEIRK